MSGVPFGVYAIVQNFNFALKFQPQAFASLTLIAWGQTLYYQNKWRAWTATVATIALAASFGIMELILILTLRGPYERGVEWPMMLMAILASVIQVIGLIPPYFELAKRNGRVIGIDFWFLTIDYAGAFFSLMAQWFDALGASLYIACMVLETGIFASQAIWLWRVRHIRRAAKKVGKTYDEYIAENTKKIPRSDSAETIVDVEAAREKDTTDARSEKTAVTTEECNTGSETEWNADSTRMTVKQALDALEAPPAATLKDGRTS
ncbi:pq loop repeat [Pyrenophora seminiperda CCB06]|uniref:Pq loop repeat n=1 Tax=Pyrenophora seminiperda CCB06 TaxID=1302712 RepID=A0A3M7M590_9PLEO|nr:pq loop repeat [Pyrenophora seminiperda CCB06]